MGKDAEKGLEVFWGSKERLFGVAPEDYVIDG
jgi:hypothetical protein